MKLNKLKISKILDGYDIGKYKNHKYLDEVLENDVYVLRTDKGKYILKVLKNVKLKGMREQLELIDFLYSKKIPVVKNIRDREGKELIKYTGDSIIIQGFVEGIHQDDFDTILTKNIARHVGKMHRVLLKSKFGITNKKHHNYKKRNPDSIKKYKLKEIQKDLFRSLNSMNKTKFKRARIHSDLTEPNLLIINNKLNAIIDWDDSDYDYLVYEIAIFLAHSCVRSDKIYRNIIKIFLREYGNYIRLNKEEKKAIYFLMKYRLFGILNWYLHYIKIHPEKHDSLKKGIKRSVERIVKFDKFSFEEFMKLL